MLYRLFNEEKVHVFPAESVEFKCRCSRDKISTTLRSMGQADLEAILAERDTIQVDCEFCGEQQHFTQTDVIRLFQ